MPSSGWRIRAAALIAVGALGVHDLRYLLTYKAYTSHELALQGHAYLRFATPLGHGGWLALPLALAIGLLIALALRGAAAAIAVAASRGRVRLRPPAAASVVSRVGRSVWTAPSLGELAGMLAPRAPPASSFGS